MRLEEKLSRYVVPDAEPSAAEKAVEAALVEHRRSRAGGACAWRSLLEQLCYTRPLMWALQLAVLAGCCLIMAVCSGGKGGGEDLLLILSVAAPLLVLINIADFHRIIHRSMLEIEMATKYGLQRIALAKLLIFGVGDILILAVLAAVATGLFRNPLLATLLWCALPFTTMCLGCMLLLQAVPAGQFPYCSAALAGLLIAAALLLHERGWMATLAGAWPSPYLCVGTFLLLMRQGHKWLSKLPAMGETLH